MSEVSARPFRSLGVAACRGARGTHVRRSCRRRDFTKTGKVTYVVDGDTLDVRLTSGKTERVRVIGIDSPERGVCGASDATQATRSLAGDKNVTLVGDGTQDTRDRYGRLLAYVWLPSGKDLGYQLVAEGHAKVYVYLPTLQTIVCLRKR